MATLFEWDEAKAHVNVARRGVSFELAQYAFLDRRRVIVPDLSIIAARSNGTSASAGWTAASRRCSSHGVADASGLLARDIGVKESGSMKKRTIRHTEGEIGRIRAPGKDFLPSPDKLVLRESNVKVTLSLSRKSVDFFKREAKKSRVPYQRMIRALVDAYAERERD
jgi:hypothetical protein